MSSSYPTASLVILATAIGATSCITLDILCRDELIMSPCSRCVTGVFSLPQGVNLTRQTWVGLPSIWFPPCAVRRGYETPRRRKCNNNAMKSSSTLSSDSWRSSSVTDGLKNGEACGSSLAAKGFRSVRPNLQDKKSPTQVRYSSHSTSNPTRP